MAERQAQVIWEGNLTQGNGKITSGSGALGELPVTWAARTERADGKTSPEELIAAAHAACFAMAFSNTLNTAGSPPQRLMVTAVCTLDRVDGKLKITTMDLEVTGTVPGLDQAGFERIARQAEQGCPVSNALRNNVEIRVNAHLD
ncbi:MAG: OsmC family peroxiredoxin [Ktedonobacterales bacterium]|nr:OsmC family peroxiredoxin [Ktedonobacterales bacterium]